MDVWRLVANSNRGLSLGTDLDFFEDHFVGKPMRDRWVPPEIDILGKSKPLRDFVGWMWMAPVISERAKEVLAPLIATHVEFLPLIQIHGKDYYAINVTRLVDCLDRTKSSVKYEANEGSKIRRVDRFHLRPEAVVDVPIFKLVDYPIDVFVRERFVDAIRDAQLTGASFADPSVNPLEAIARGESQNTVTGIRE